MPPTMPVVAHAGTPRQAGVRRRKPAERRLSSCVPDAGSCAVWTYIPLLVRRGLLVERSGPRTLKVGSTKGRCGCWEHLHGPEMAFSKPPQCTPKALRKTNWLRYV